MIFFLILLLYSQVIHCADPRTRRFTERPTEEQIAQGIASMRHHIGQRLEHRLPTPWHVQAAQERDNAMRATLEQNRTTRRRALVSARRSTHPQDPTSRVPAASSSTHADEPHIPEPPQVVRRTYRLAEMQPERLPVASHTYGPFERSRIVAREERFYRPSTPPSTPVNRENDFYTSCTPVDQTTWLYDRVRTLFPELSPREINNLIERAYSILEHRELRERADCVTDLIP